MRAEWLEVMGVSRAYRVPPIVTWIDLESGGRCELATKQGLKMFGVRLFRKPRTSPLDNLTR